MRKPKEVRSDTRVLWIGRVVVVWAICIAAQLVRLQILKHEEYARKAEGQQVHKIVLEPDRGEILDRNGHPLAISVRTKTAAINPQRVENAGFFAESVGAILEFNAKETADLAARIQFLQAVKAKREQNAALTKEEEKESLNQLVLKRHIADEQCDRLKRLPFKFIEVLPDSRRHYPNDMLAAQVIGTMGQVKDDQEKTVRGVVGIERRFEDELRGQPVILKALTDSQQDRYYSWVTRKGTPGANLRLTIHQVIQEEAETQLEIAVAKNHAKRGFLVAMDPQNGEILALANYPSFDPNNEKPSPEEFANRVNQNISLPLEPGSVMKMITITTGLDTGKVTPETLVNCENGVWPRPNRKPIHDLHRYGTMSVAQVLIKSSNIGAGKVAVICGRETMFEYLQRFGMGEKTGLGLPGESRGIFWPIKYWNSSTHEYIAFGHNISATPVQLARAVSVIANGGKLVTPTLIYEKEIIDSETGRSVMVHPERPAPRQVIQVETSHTVRMLMQQVIEEGTGRLAKVPGYTAGGKTGTAELIDPATKQYLKNRNASSFIGFAPVTNPRIVVVATVYDTSEKGGPAAGPMFSAVVRTALRVLNVPQDKFETLARSQPLEPNVEVQHLEPLKSKPEPPVIGPQPLSAADRNLVGPRVPDFKGKTVATVMRESASQGLPVEIVGRGTAHIQKPPAGAILPSGERVLVEFARE
jgi:cell division protein FtsI (penicillin-binding protein 3)